MVAVAEAAGLLDDAVGFGAAVADAVGVEGQDVACNALTELNS